MSNASLQALVGGRVYDGPPRDPAFPYLSFGPGYGVDEGGDDLDAEDVTIQVDIWCDDQQRRGPCSDLVDLVREIFQRQSLDLDFPFSASAVRVPVKRVMLDPSGYVHGVVQITAFVERL
ncbi:MAG: DUF3168 domain-containing protein [Rhodobacteraceae bacterium]|nr:DUF3168 domain-containing protein [Paracoccaceae bacterium]MBR9823735.1 DUF3168 domain-containing protein [Paracoccaceae bacterium]